MTADYLAVDDGGNGGNKLDLLEIATGKTKQTYEASVRAVATGDTLGMEDGMAEIKYQYIDWYGSRYVTGDDVIRVTRRGLERHMGANRYGEEFHRFLVASALAKAGVKEGAVDLTLFAPPGMYKEAREKILNGFQQNDGKVEIKLKNDKKPRQWRYSNVRVMPEGIGVAAAFMFNKSGEYVGGDIFAGENIILDPGAYTLDAIKLVDGSFNPESLEHATIENGGVNTHVREPLLRLIHKQSDDFKVVTIDDVDLVLRRGLIQGNWTLEIAGKELNLESAAKKLFVRYADWVANNVCDGVFNGFRGIKSVIIASGGQSMIGDQLAALYPGKILEQNKFAHVKGISPVFLNAVGGMRFALMQMKQKA